MIDDALKEYSDALKESEAAKKASLKASDRERRAHVKLAQAKDRLWAAEREMMEDIHSPHLKPSLEIMRTSKEETILA